MAEYPDVWEWDLFSVYSAYVNHFQLHDIPWYDRTWGYLFADFQSFLSFGWPSIVLTDASTGRAHIVTHVACIDAFLKMIQIRFGDVLPIVENMLRISPAPFETPPRYLEIISNHAMYEDIYRTLPASALAAQKIHVRKGERKWIQDLWDRREKTFLAIDFEWSERNVNSYLEWGYAAVRCGHLDAVGIWPPVPERNYRRGHYIVAEYVDKVHNKHCPTYPWEYAFGESRVIPKAKLGEIIQTIINSLVSPESETLPNQLVLVTHGAGGDLDRLADLQVKLPSNVLIVDTAVFERRLFVKGHRGTMIDPQTNKPRQPGTNLSLRSILGSLNADIGCTWHCSGNDAFGMLLALQLLLQPENTKIPEINPIKRTPIHSSTLGLTLNTNLGSGHTAASGTLIGAAPTPKPISARNDYSTAPRVTPQQLEAPPPFKENGMPLEANGLTQAGMQGVAHMSLNTSGPTSKRNFKIPLKFFKMGGSRFIPG